MSVHSSSVRRSSTWSRTPSSPVRYVRCVGPIILNSPLARDIACLLDLDPTVSSWTCRTFSFSQSYDNHKPDIVAERDNDILVIDAVAKAPPPTWIADAVRDQGYSYRAMTRGDVDPTQLKNAKDLLRYSGTDVGLGDRVRLLAGLEEHGSLPVSECLSAFRETPPIAGLASLVLQRIVEIDLDSLIGPETQVRRFRG